MKFRRLRREFNSKEKKLCRAIGISEKGMKLYMFEIGAFA